MNRGSPVMLYITGLWPLGVLAWVVWGGVTGSHRDSDAILTFFLGQSGIVSGAVFVGTAFHHRRWLVVPGMLAVLLLTVFLFLYFPMSPAACDEWVEWGIRTGRYAKP